MTKARRWMGPARALDFPLTVPDADLPSHAMERALVETRAKRNEEEEKPREALRRATRSASSGRFVHDDDRFPNAKDMGFWDFVRWKRSVVATPRPTDSDLLSLSPVAIDFEKLASPPTSGAPQCTWLGHATVLVQMGGWTVLTDPLMTNRRCSPIPLLGPQRLVEPPIGPRELTDSVKIDVVLISHNHYDHLDVATVTALAKQRPSPPLWLVPLGLKPWMADLGIRNVVELDWSEQVTMAKAGRPPATFTCLPAQHFSSRGPLDRNATLWASWLCSTAPVEAPASKGHKFYFAGDSGSSPIYERIGQVHGPIGKSITTSPSLPLSPPPLSLPLSLSLSLGCAMLTHPRAPRVFLSLFLACLPIDLCALPIGAYGHPSERWFMEPVHMDCEEAVRAHRDLGSVKSIGIHWGTFQLTAEPILDPPRQLKRALKAANVRPSDFVVLRPGETDR